MPTRIIRDGILTSARINQLSERAELFYRRLMSVVDDHGRFHATSMLLRASCYPLKLDTIKDEAIESHLAEAVAADLLTVYVVNGLKYLQLSDFGQRVQSKSKFPDPPVITESHGESPYSTVNIRLGGVVVEGVVEGERASTPTVKRQRKAAEQTLPAWLAALPADEDALPADDPLVTWATQTGIPPEWLGYAWTAFEDKYGDGAKTYTDWRAVFRKAVKGDWLKVWRMTPAGPVLTTVGEQLRRAA